jgi:hypothetical protein
VSADWGNSKEVKKRYIKSIRSIYTIYYKNIRKSTIKIDRRLI